MPLGRNFNVGVGDFRVVFHYAAGTSVRGGAEEPVSIAGKIHACEKRQSSDGGKEDVGILPAS